jgi:hypothetical protein
LNAFYWTDATPDIVNPEADRELAHSCRELSSDENQGGAEVWHETTAVRRRSEDAGRSEAPVRRSNPTTGPFSLP